LGAQVSDQPEPGFILHERGLAVASGVTDAFTKGLDYLIRNESLRRELGRRGHDFVNQNYAKERLLADMTALYARLLNVESAAEAATHNSLSPSPLGEGRGEGLPRHWTLTLSQREREQVEPDLKPSKATIVLD